MGAEKINYSKEQEKIIYSNEKTLLVSASAGSGKTKVLVERIVDLIINKKVNIKNMLVVTFTKLASLEMKSRLKNELEKYEKTEDVLSQLDQLNTANISTLHKFCEVVIKEFFYQVQIDPNFSILEGMEETYFKNIAIDKVIEKYSSAEDEDFDELYEIFYENRNDDLLKKNVFDIYDFLLSKSANYFEETINNAYCDDLEKNVLVKFITEEKQETLNQYLDFLENILIEATAINDKQLDAVQQNIERIKLLKESGYFDFNNNYTSTKFSYVSSSKKMSAEEKDLCEQLKAFRDEFKKTINKLSLCFPLSKENFSNDLNKSKKILLKFYEIIRAFEWEYSQLKVKENKLDFNDLEKYMLQILANNNIRECLQQKYKYIFVDEYQDTNLVQEQIIQGLTKDNYVFMVGDVKQSIYMFRECDPQIFIGKSERLSKESPEQLVLLNKNYRSDKNILEFGNMVFNKVMTTKTAKLDYKATSQLVFGEVFKEINEDIPKVNICLLKFQEKAKEKESPNKIYSILDDDLILEDESEIDRQAYLIADKINGLLSVEIYDKNLNANRKIEYKDIAILTRKGKFIKRIANVLNSLNIPINSEYKIDVFASNEVQLLISILKTINNYKDDIALANVLKSMAYNFSDYDLVQIKQKYNNDFFYQNVEEYSMLSDNIATKLKKFFNDIDYFKKYIMQKNISEGLQEIIRYFDFQEKFYACENYCEVIENINYFINVIKEIDNYNLTALIDYLDNVIINGEQVVTIKNGINSVYIGTTHSSKGLEYPVVFLANIDVPFSNQSIIGKVIKNSEFGIAMDVYDTYLRTKKESIIKNILKLKIKEQEKQEEMRLLYVALTRAQCYLFLIGGYNKANFEPLKNEYQIKHSTSYLDFIMGSMEKNVLEQINHGKEKIVVNNKSFKYSIENYVEYQISKDNDTTKEYIANDVLINKYLDYVNHCFKHNDYSFKNTVTALTEAEDIENYNIKDFKQSYKKEDEQDFLIIGTQYHKMMEMLDFNEPFEEQYEKIINSECLDVNLFDKSKLKNAYDIISKLIESDDIVLREKQFMFYPKINDVIKTDVDANILIQGMVDLMIIKKESIIIVDYKTSRIGDEQTMIKKYKLQLDLYSKAIECFYKKTVEKKYIYSFYADKLIIV